MEKYIKQLLTDIDSATRQVRLPFIDRELTIQNWISPDEEEAIAPVRILSEWTGITVDMLPPVSLLTESQVGELLESLKKMLGAYNCHFVLQMTVPEEIQYETIRQNLDQSIKIRRWHMGFFQFCRPDTIWHKCVLGAYCHCAFFDEFVAGKKSE